MACTRKPKNTICWECRKATGGCSWSEYKVNRPVAGWAVMPTNINGIESYIVLECPEFERDAEPGGLKRLSRREQNDRKRV